MKTKTIAGAISLLALGLAATPSFAGGDYDSTPARAPAAEKVELKKAHKTEGKKEAHKVEKGAAYNPTQSPRQ